MPSPTIPVPAKRYFRPGKTRVIKCAIAASTLVPTLAELNAGTDVSNEINSITGFTVTTSDLPAPNLAQRFVPVYPGSITADQSQIVFYGDADGADVRSLFAQDAETNLVFLDDGFATGSAMDAYKVRVSAVTKPKSLTELATLAISYSILAYNENQTVPAS